jgi:hypothetical protein
VFDINDFYPSIDENLLINAITFAQQHTIIDEDDKSIIRHARKSFIFNDGISWIKKESELFDVTMGAYDGAEVCELVGIFILYQISQFYNKNDFVLYRDDGLAIFKNKSGQQMERIKKHFVKIFKNNNLSISINCNIKIVNYLDLTLNLIDNSFQPYSKPENTLNYVHADSNHPPTIINNLPQNIELRLSTISSNEVIFNKSKPIYEDALNQSGYTYKLAYKPRVNSVTKNNHKRNIIWYNPPFSKSVTTKIGQRFLTLIDQHFPKNHKLHKIFNRNTIKISYSCMPNIKSIINSHNKNILYGKKKLEKTCNCIIKSLCPLSNQCLTSNIVYQAIVSSNKPEYKDKVYIGISETPFKLRYANHIKSFNTTKYRNDTELSKEIWELKENNLTPLIKWNIIKHCRPYNPASKIYNL